MRMMLLSVATAGLMAFAASQATAQNLGAAAAGDVGAASAGVGGDAVEARVGAGPVDTTRVGEEARIDRQGGRIGVEGLGTVDPGDAGVNANAEAGADFVPGRELDPDMRQPRSAAGPDLGANAGGRIDATRDFGAQPRTTFRDQGQGDYQGQGYQGQGDFAGQSGNVERWRYRQHNGEWWYWLPDERWVYWRDGRWQDYNPQTFRSVQPSYGYSDSGYYAPSFGYSYSPGYTSGYSGYYSPRYHRGYYGSNWGYGSGYYGSPYGGYYGGYYGSPYGRHYTGRQFYENRGEWRGANIGGAIGGAVGGPAGAGIGAAIGGAIGR